MTDACETARHDMALDLYGELSEDEQARLEDHLEGCARCRRDLDALRAGLGQYAAPTTQTASTSPRLASSRPRTGLVPLSFAAAAGFLAGVLSMLAAPTSAPPVVDPPPLGSVELAQSFGLESAPPRSTSPSRLTSLRRWKR